MSPKSESGAKPLSDHHADCDHLSAGELRVKYAGEYSSWKNMKSRCRAGAAELDPAFVNFRDFLRAVGPKPSKAHSIDRRENQNRVYGPGLVRWSDPKTQANNRSSTRQIEYEGEKLPLTEVAQKTGLKADTLRKRLQRGRTSADLLIGPSNRSSQWPGPQEEARIRDFEKAYASRPITLEGETRAEFYIGHTMVMIGHKRKFIARTQEILDYLRDGTLPVGRTAIDMEWSWEREFRSPDSATLEISIERDLAYIKEAEARILEAKALMPTSKHTPPD